MENRTIRYKLQRHRWPDEIRADRRRVWMRILVVGSIVLAFLLGGYVGAFVFGGSITSNNQNPEFQKFVDIYEVMRAKWYFGKDIEDLEAKLIQDAIDGMIAGGGDPHTDYMNAEESKEFTDRLEGSFVGIGVQYYTVNGSHLVERTLLGSPAEKVGIMPGDILYKVDGVEITNKTATEVSSMVRGEKGTKVVVTVLRGSQEIVYEITRAEILNSVSLTMMDEHVAWLEISQFASSTDEELLTYLLDLQSKGVTKLLIDLRGNGGGYLDTLENMAAFFLPNDSIVIQQEFRSGDVKVSRVKNAKNFTFTDVVVLIDEYTASAAEVLAAAMSEVSDVPLVGVTTYGKGTVQIPMGFGDGSILKYTTAQWLTPDGNAIHGKGIKPTHEVILHAGAYAQEIDMDQAEYRYDDVATAVAQAQGLLEILQLNPGRTDGYFSKQTEDQIKVFQAQVGLEATGILDKPTATQLSAAALRYWHTNRMSLDNQLQFAYDLVK